MGEYYHTELSEYQIQMYTEDLLQVAPEDLIAAVKLYRRNPKNTRFPLLAQLITLTQPSESAEEQGLAKEWELPLEVLLNAASEQLEAASDISSIIRRARIKMNLSQKEVSLDLGYTSQTSYSRIERGEKLLSEVEKAQLAGLLNIPQNILMSA